MHARLDVGGSRSLAERASDPALTAEACDLDHWLAETAQGMLAGTRRGHAPSTRVPEHMLRPGPLRSAMRQTKTRSRTTRWRTAVPGRRSSRSDSRASAVESAPRL